MSLQQAVNEIFIKELKEVLGLKEGGNKKVEIVRERRKLKDWEMDTGIRIKGVKDKGKRCKERTFKNLIKTKEIVVKTNKGLEYLESIKDDNKKRIWSSNRNSK